MTISCQTYGHEWGTDGFGRELDRLERLGINWVAIHPYARIHSDGHVTFGYSRERHPSYLVRPIKEAHRRGMRVMIKPHLAYWGSRFSWRGEIYFDQSDQRERFRQTYRDWILTLAEVVEVSDLFVIGTETDRLAVEDDDYWRDLIAAVRSVTDAKLTYASNWDYADRLDFWPDLDYIGIQAYFPLTERRQPTREDLDQGWERITSELKALSGRHGKPILFTELGYNTSVMAARMPWDYHQTWGERRGEAEALQALCVDVALAQVERHHSWIKGCFLWKWFVGPSPGENFVLDKKKIHDVVINRWNRKTPVPPTMVGR